METTLQAIKDDVKILEESSNITQKTDENQENVEKIDTKDEKTTHREDTGSHNTIELINSQLGEAQNSYETKNYSKMKKPELVKEYYKICDEYNYTNRKTENQLKKTKKYDIEMLIFDIKGHKDNKTPQQGVVGGSPITPGYKKSLAKGLFNMNLVATTIVEKVNGAYVDQTGFDIQGLSYELAQPKAEKDQIPIFESMVDQYPDISKYLGNALLQYSMYMGKMGIQRASHNNNFPPINPSKQKRTMDNVKNSSNNTNNIFKPKNNYRKMPKTKDTGWITLRNGKKIRDPSSFSTKL